MAAASLSEALLASFPGSLSPQSNQDVIDLIWDPLDRDRLLTDLSEFPDISTVARQGGLISAHSKNAGPMPLEFASFLTKDPSSFSFAHRVHPAAKYMTGSNLPAYHIIWIKIVNAFLVIYINCSRSARGRIQSRVYSILKRLKDLMFMVKIWNWTRSRLSFTLPAKQSKHCCSPRR